MNVRLVLVAACVCGLVNACSSTPSPGPDDSGLDAAFDSAADSGHSGPCTSAADCSDGTFCNGAERCVPGSAGADSRGCTAALDPVCLASQTCNEAMDRCTTTSCAGDAGDADADGHRAIDCGGDDCDDADANRFPGRTEICDAMMHDEDCDSSTFGFRDGDSDGVADARCCNVESVGHNVCGTDCNDAAPSISPTGTEACNGLDDDCDGALDEGVLQAFTVDADHDSFGEIGGATVMGCFVMPGYAVAATDCDDTRSAVHPGAVEICDPTPDGGMPLDENCDGIANPPALCLCAVGDSQQCMQPGVCAAGTQDCGTGMWGACSIIATTETCNYLDDDCNGITDDMLQVPCYPDADNDGYSANGATLTPRCPQSGRESVGSCPAFFTDRAPFGTTLDCNDGAAVVHPGASEVCDPSMPARDENCNGTIDEGVAQICYADADGDGYALTGAPGVSRCIDGSRADGCPFGTTARAPASPATADCNDGAAASHPGLLELCDGVLDENCNGMTDEGCLCTTGSTRPCPQAGVCMTGIQSCTAGTWGSCSIGPTPEVCNTLDDNCNGTADEGVSQLCYVDADDDRYAPSGAVGATRCIDGTHTGGCPLGYTERAPSSPAFTDCRDTAPTAHPGGLEVCEGSIDENCNGTVDEGCMCTNGMMRACPQPGLCAAGQQTCGAGTWGACTIAPVAEVCNALHADEDCDGLVDEAVAQPCYQDTDGDGYALSGTPGVSTCLDLSRPDHCPVGTTARSPSGASNTDCDDVHAAAHPGGTEVCEGSIDENCSGAVDEICICTNGSTRQCPQPGACAAGIQSCTVGAWGSCSISPMAEACNGLDDNCNGSVDEGTLTNCYTDADTDGYAPSTAIHTQVCGACGTMLTTRAPVGGSNTDCDDTRILVHPGATETCDGRDTDCSSGTASAVAGEDADGDMHTAIGYGLCTGGYPIDDCQDLEVNVHPGQSTYFGTPYCPNGSSACAFCGGQCVMGSSGGICDVVCAGIVARTYDYDCGGSLQREPSDTDNCSGGTSTFCATVPGCGSSHPYYVGSPACGSSVHYWTCGCGGARCNAGTLSSHPLGCH